MRYAIARLLSEYYREFPFWREEGRAGQTMWVKLSGFTHMGNRSSEISMRLRSLGWVPLLHIQLDGLMDELGKGFMIDVADVG